MTTGKETMAVVAGALRAADLRAAAQPHADRSGLPAESGEDDLLDLVRPGRGIMN